MRNITAIMMFLLLATCLPAQVTLNVPTASYPTIQSGIAAASNGDTVAVGPGVFVENIDFIGKTITVRGQGPNLSVIDGGQQDSTVVFTNQEGPGTTLEGFTITNGLGRSVLTLSSGGGILVLGPNPVGRPHRFPPDSLLDHPAGRHRGESGGAPGDERDRAGGAVGRPSAAKRQHRPYFTSQRSPE